MFAYCGNNPVIRYDPTGHNWWNTLWEDIRDWLEEKKEEAENNEDGTVAFGSTGTVSAVLAFSRATGITFDRKGNVGVIVTNSSGAGMPSASIAVYGSVTNAPDIYKQEGSGVTLGTSAGAEFVSAGYDYSVLFDDISNKEYNGHTLSVGVGVSSPCVEMHILKDNSYVRGVNLYDIGIAFAGWMVQLGG